MIDNLCALEVVIDGDVQPAREYHHNGQVFIMSTPSEYVLRFRNKRAGRILVVPSVDGLSVMDGQPASDDSSGYVINPHDSCDVPGWRLDNGKVARFVFGSRPEAYATYQGGPENIGVIGAIVYAERQRIPTYPTLRSFDGPVGDSVTRGGGRSRGFGSNMGTGFGKAEEHRVTSVTFERQLLPVARIALYYDDRKGLESRGIRVIDQDTPNPFPGNQKLATACLPPAGWRG